MLFKRKKRAIVDYLAATENEIALDLMFLELVSLDPERVGYLPRVPKWITHAKRNPELIKAVWILARAAWILGGACMYFFVQMISVCLRKRHQKPLVHAVSAGCVLGLSSRVGDIVTKNAFPDFPTTWLSVPWAPLRTVPPNTVVVELFSMLSVRELLTACRDAITATYIIFGRRRKGKWVLQSYTAFNWFCVRTAVEKIEGTLVTAEHFDRWAVLVDSAAKANARRTGINASNGSLVLVQHGSLAGLTEDTPESQMLNLYRRLRSVTHAYVYGADAERAFERNVFSRASVRRGIAISYFIPDIRLTKSAIHSDQVRILFVGHPLCERLHICVYEQLCKEASVKAFYKPHPKAPMSDKIRDLDWEVIEEATFFPVVDLLVSYESTLVVEYRAQGISAAVHSITLSPEDMEGYLETVYAVVAQIQREMRPA